MISNFDDFAEIDPQRCGGKPVLKGTRFTLSQVLAELAEGTGPKELADEFDLDQSHLENLLRSLSKMFSI